MSHNKENLNRRDFLKITTAATAALATGLYDINIYGKQINPSRDKKVIVLGIDGMDPKLTEAMMDEGLLPNFDNLRKQGGYSPLQTSIPPLSPVAWANFITGNNPGAHGIFAFINRDPSDPCKQYDPISEIKPGIGIGVGNYKLPLRQSKTILKRQGVPFWDYLDMAGISSAVYLVPSNYPPSRSKYGNHKSLSGMGTPDLLGTIGTYQYFTADGPEQPEEKNDGIHRKLVFKDETANLTLSGPHDIFFRKPQRTLIEFSVHRDMSARAALIEIQDQKVLLKEGQWSSWIKVDFELSTPFYIPDKHVTGICRFYLQELSPNFKLYVSPININPSEPAMIISEPEEFSAEIVKQLGPFFTLGFQEAYKARINNIFSDQEYAVQSEIVLETRIKLLDYALKHYDKGLLFFYFSSTDLQSHIFWWDTDKPNPVRNREMAVKYNDHIKSIYKKMDDILGDVLHRFGSTSTIFALSDHGFSYFKRYFNLNTWLRENGYIRPSYCNAICPKDSSEIGPNWYQTKAYGLDVNDLYLNLKGREAMGSVQPQEKEELLEELITKLEAVRDTDGSPVIRKVYRTDKVYCGDALKNAPELILGFYRGYRGISLVSNSRMADDIFADNKDAWGADHCFAAEEVPGVLFCNKPFHAQQPSLIDLAPSILSEYGIPKPATMTGTNIFAS